MKFQNIVQFEYIIRRRKFIDMKKYYYGVCALSGIFLLIFITGCSSIIDSRKQKTTAMQEFTLGDFKQAAQSFDSKADSRDGTGDELMWRLEQGVLNFYAGDYKTSLKAFDKAEQLINDFDERAKINLRAGAAEAGSALTNLNALPYKGFNYDRVLLNTYKALDYFALSDPSSACVELRRAYEQQKAASKRFDSELKEINEQIETTNKENKDNKGSNLDFNDLLKNDKIQKSYNRILSKSNNKYGNFINPFVSYMLAIGYLSENDYNNAYVSFKNLYLMEPGNKLIERDLVTSAVRTGNDIPPKLSKIKPYNYSLNDKIVFVIFATGLAPALKQVKVQFPFPYVGYTGFAYPELEYFPNYIKKAEIKNSTGDKYFTTVVSNMDSIISQEYSKLLPVLITRIAVSTLSKELASIAAIEAAKYAGRQAGLPEFNNALGGNLAGVGGMALTSMYKYSFNTADTRCWETLPKEYQVTHLPMPKNGILFISNPESKLSDENKEIKLNTNKKITIVYIRAPSKNVFSIKIFEFN